MRKDIPKPRKLSRQELTKIVAELSAQIAASKARCVWIVQTLLVRPLTHGRSSKQVLGL